ncbi:Bromodomain containing protein [Trichomonas vaginalis G3]|uniref:Bromodomain containing protein n=1 Tax=Trichomonas vaginalis (strain ATCC PRA-98 / G3) TaxID=412133 RepID=A2DM67_TRIV3|nr:bromodomain family [Trichomonas vaginalis G3]EAY18487.1 Bromodomain containing protein [Trichomonas vaginalis G3]KAI5489524.1 bromodomain family [Trichomonas vaginalis G3]|eukprot:XP_001579473.1 Bromodomain containing protein [Trichomonas vaginalis G3]
MKRPCAKIFIDPIVPDTESYSNYYSIIDNPMDLNTIYQRIIHNVYQDVDEVTRDINFIVTNSIKFYGSNHCATYLAKHLAYLYEKSIRLHLNCDFNDWHKIFVDQTQNINSMLNKFAETHGLEKRYFDINERKDATVQTNSVEMNIHRPPPNDEIIKSNLFDDYVHSSKEKSKNSDDKKYTKKIKRKIPESKINNFLSALSNLSLSDAKQLVSITISMQPELNIPFPEARIDIDELKDKTILKLIEYTRSRFLQLNLPYPTT